MKDEKSDVDAATGAAAPSLVEQLVEALEKIAKQKSDVDAATGAAASQDTARIDALESFVNKHNDMDPEADPEAFEDLTVSDLAQLEQGFNYWNNGETGEYLEYLPIRNIGNDMWMAYLAAVVGREITGVASTPKES